MNASFVSPNPNGATHLSSIHTIRAVGIFWDIENCNVPFNRSVIKLVERIRRLVFERQLRESEFLVVCDTHKANNDLLDDLNSSQVTVVHVSSSAKNAADDKLKQQIVRFIEANGYDSALLVLTDDINFATVLSDLRNRYRVEIILIQRQASDSLKFCADTVVDFQDLCRNLPMRSNNALKEAIVLVSNLPTLRKPVDIKRLLHKLSANCGGKKITLNLIASTATIRFSCFDDAKRAQQRIDRQDVFGNKIFAVLLPNEPKPVLTSESSDNSDLSPLENTSLRTNCVDTAPDMWRTRARNHSQPTPDLQLNELMPFCTIHSKKHSKHWTETHGSTKSLLPTIHISIPVLSARVHHLLDTHGGAVPLNSFLDCYSGEFHELFNSSDKPLVALEHLITCVPGVCISISPTNCIKRVTWVPNRDKYLLDDSINSEPMPKTDRTYATHLSHFGKEVRELLKSHMHATIPFNKFVPAYHTHFVRQLCVGQYGCLKLSELMDEIPHIVHVYGENDGRMITLTHREQTKRFATDLIKVLKAQNGRRLRLSEFSAAYESVFEKPFDVCDYGVCYVEDILRDVWEGTVIITPFGTNDRWIEIPKKDRTADQIKRTAHFAHEVIELLKCSKEVMAFELTFSKFIPCYHRYYNKQCRVSDYGFAKLIELLEELAPKVIEIVSNEKFGEKQLRLNYENRLKALIYRFELILKKFESRSALISNFEREYYREFKSKVDYIEYYANDLIDLIDKMPANKFRITQTKSETKIILLDSEHFQLMAKRAARLLMEESNAELSLAQLENQYLEQFGETLSSHVFSDLFKETFVVNSHTNSVRLTELFLFGRQCIQVLQTSHKKKLTLDELDRELMKKFERPLPQPNAYKCTGFPELLAKFFDYFRIEKRKTGKYLLLISLDSTFIKKPLVVKPPVYQILKRPELQQTIDIMGADVPKSLPLPDLLPSTSAKVETDLIYWSSISSDSSDKSSNSPNLMDFNENQEIDRSNEVNVKDDWSESSHTTGADELHSNLQKFSITNGFCQHKKSRIIANFS